MSSRSTSSASRTGARPNRRQKADILKLVNAKYALDFPDENRNSNFFIKFAGPEGTLYAGGVWTLQVTLPEDYPYKSPSVGFMNRIYHPNVDEISGSICLDVINQTWTPMFDLSNIFETFIPQLLRYPNPADPLNGQAARLLLKDEIRYNARVREYVALYAQSHKQQHATIDEDVVAGASECISPAASSASRTVSVCPSPSSAIRIDTSSLDEGMTSMCDSSSFADSQLASSAPSSSEGDMGLMGKLAEVDGLIIESYGKGGRQGDDGEDEEEMLWETLSDVSEMSDL